MVLWLDGFVVLRLYGFVALCCVVALRFDTFESCGSRTSEILMFSKDLRRKDFEKHGFSQNLRRKEFVKNGFAYY